MAEGTFEGLTVDSPEIRSRFTRKVMLSSNWYRERLKTQQQIDRNLWQRHVKYLDRYAADRDLREEACRLEVDERLASARDELARVNSDEYLAFLEGSLGADPVVLPDDN